MKYEKEDREELDQCEKENRGCSMVDEQEAEVPHLDGEIVKQGVFLTEGEEHDFAGASMNRNSQRAADAYMDEDIRNTGYNHEKYSENGKRDRENCLARRRNKTSDRTVLLLILVVLFGMSLIGPILGTGFSIIFTLIGTGIAVVGCLIALLVSGFALAGALAGVGVSLIISGCMNMTQLAVSLMLVGVGFLMLAAAVLTVVGMKGVWQTAVPKMVRFTAETVRKCIRWGSSLVHRVLGKGGAGR